MTNNKTQTIIIITGPTATGKTLLGIQLAKQLNGEVISADSMQVYKHMDIGTAKPTAEEMGGIPHHMIDIVEPQEDYSVARYVQDAVPIIDNIRHKGKIPIVVGGSGLYIDSLIRGRTFASHVPRQLRDALEEEYDNLGGKAMLSKLRDIDPESAAKLHENDKKRIVRAFEVIKTTGKPLSQHDAAEKELPDRYDALFIALTFSDRAVLYDRINRRVDDMISCGLADEVTTLLSKGIPRSCTSMQAIGYKEIAEALNSGNKDLSGAIAKIKMESTRYAKRQLTWLRRNKRVHWINWDTSPDIDKGTFVIKGLHNEAE